MFNDTIWAFVGLILFFALLQWLKVPSKIGGALDKQADNIKTELDEARKLREEAQSILAEYQRKRTEAEAEAEQIVADAKLEAERMAAEANEALEEMIARRTKAAEAKIGQAEANAIAEVKARAAEVAAAAAEEIVTSSLSDADTKSKVVSESIKQISARLN
ncbi:MULTISPECIES: ATP F0F1 synthase subunit B [Pseudovibrio]|uniref:F0F1 ATP synthase subunit B family protein n=1 Tax=Stappiaceae TaxID=2821832 RepID=UPI00236591B0|nr:MULTISPECIES: ATP F0F1 synthase subunit B [Pseudovibrio]MDD7911254.1 ATP F0F1 synthase subunit B [Pseudovibrio exalbescens]MDX5593059.1 ATP F0F1 synthase subunit B [Pseudovibrio sp. SPO723]